jgi:uncharacterized damage-inducible protein DinB
MTQAVLSLPKETVEKTIMSSFNSLRLTLLHMWNAESIWWQRSKLAETIQTKGDTNSSIDEIAAGLMAQSKEWETWVEKSTPAAFEHEFIYRNSKRSNLNNLFTRYCCTYLIIILITEGNWLRCLDNQV